MLIGIPAGDAGNQPATTMRALLSVSDKAALVTFARALNVRGYELVSTGGTAKALASAPADLVLKPDGGELFVPSPATHGLVILNTWTNEVAEHILLGDAPSRGSLTADAHSRLLRLHRPILHRRLRPALRRRRRDGGRACPRNRHRQL